MKIVIVGPGAIGLLLAAFLSRTKENIWLLDKDKDRAQELNSKGIKIEGIAGEWQVKVNCTASAKDIGTADLIIVAVKSYATKAIPNEIKSLINEETLILTIQNGLGNVEVLAEEFGQGRIISGITNLGATLLGIGNVKYAGKGETVIGAVDGKMSFGLRQIRETFNKARLDCRVTKDITAAIWSKLVINVGINALTAITRVKNGKLIEIEPAHQIMRLAVNEAVKVAKRKRIKLAYDDPLSKVESVCEATQDNISSMLQDVLNKKRTEIDAINGAIVRHAETLGIPVPVNSLLINLIKAIEASYPNQVKNG